MKVTTSAAMRARDVSRPHAEHLAYAEEAEADAVSARPAAVADASVPADAAYVADAVHAADAAYGADAAGLAAAPDAEAPRESIRDGRPGRPGARRHWRPRGSGRGRPSR
jgi:hypothetical protein